MCVIGKWNAVDCTNVHSKLSAWYILFTARNGEVNRLVGWGYMSPQCSDKGSLGTDRKKNQGYPQFLVEAKTVEVVSLIRYTRVLRMCPILYCLTRLLAAHNKILMVIDQHRDKLPFGSSRDKVSRDELIEKLPAQKSMAWTWIDVLLMFLLIAQGIGWTSVPSTVCFRGTSNFCFSWTWSKAEQMTKVRSMSRKRTRSRNAMSLWNFLTKNRTSSRITGAFTA